MSLKEDLENELYQNIYLYIDELLEKFNKGRFL